MSLQYGILGLLKYHGMQTGYDLKKKFDGSVNFFWAAHTSQIYRELKDLHEKGYVDYVVEPQVGKPDKKIYKITKQGEESFFEWIGEFPGYEDKRLPFLMHFFFAMDLPLEAVRYAVKQYKKEVVKQYKGLKEENESASQLDYAEMDPTTFYTSLTALRGQMVNEAIMRWCDEVLEAIEERRNRIGN